MKLPSQSQLDYCSNKFTVLSMAVIVNIITREEKVVALDSVSAYTEGKNSVWKIKSIYL